MSSKNILIANASHFLGKPIIEKFIFNDFHIILLDQNKEFLRTIYRYYRSKQKFIHTYVVNWHDFHTIENTLEEIYQSFGSIYGYISLMNIYKKHEKFENINGYYLQDILNVNYIASLLILSSIIRVMKLQNTGYIFTFSTVKDNYEENEAIYQSIQRAFHTYVTKLQQKLRQQKIQLIQIIYNKPYAEKHSISEVILNNTANQIFHILSSATRMQIMEMLIDVQKED